MGEKHIKITGLESAQSSTAIGDSVSMAGSSLLSANTQGLTPQQRKEELQKKLAESHMAAEHRAHIEKIADDDVEKVHRIKEAKRQQQKNLERPLGVDATSMKEAHGVNLIIAVVNFAFLIVVVGCELDLYGFGLSYMEYWNQENMAVRVMLVIGPTGYFLATAMYIYFHEGERKKGEEKRGKDSAGRGTFDRGNLDRPIDIEMPRHIYIAAPLKREPFDMVFYHFLPVFRFYVVVKEKEADDIEAIFRVNSLSSFTLGVAQITGIVFHLAMSQEPLTIFHKINIVSQGLNWFITFLYFFANPAVSYMKGVIEVDAMRYNDRQFLRELQKRYAGLQQQSAANDSYSGELHAFNQELDRLILGIANVQDLAPQNFAALDTDWKFSVLQRLLIKKVTRFAKA